MSSPLQEWRPDDYLRVFLFHKKSIIALTFAFALFGAFRTAQKPNLYQTSSRILIETQTPRVVQFQEVSAVQSSDRSFLQTEYQVITSRAVLTRVVDDLHLAAFPPFSRAKDPVQVLGSMVSVDPVRSTKLVDIRATGTKPELIARLANGVADTYAKVNLERRRDLTTGGAQWLQDEVTAMETRMRDAQLKLQDFREQHGAIDLGEEKQNSTLQRIQALNVSLNKTRENRIEAQTKYREKHPSLLELLNKEKELQLALFDAEQSALEMSRLSIQFNALLRETKTSEWIHNILLTRMKELLVQEGLQNNNVQVVDYALVPAHPIGPPRTRETTMPGVLGFLLGCGIALLKELLTKTVRTRQDFEILLEIPFLGHTPLLGLGRKRDAALRLFQEPHSPGLETIRSIRTTLEFLLPVEESRVLLFTSALPEEGKSTLACSLAIALHEVGRKVLVVDADLRRPSLHTTTQLALEPGLSGYLKGEADLSELIQQDSALGGLSLVTAGMSPDQPTDLLSSPRFLEFLNSARKEYQYILIDSPPVLVAADAAVISTVADGVVYIVRANRTHSEAVLTGKQRLIDVGAKVIGGILNGAHLERERGYRYYYSGRHYRTHYNQKAKKSRHPARSRERDISAASGPKESPPSQSAEGG